MTKTIVAIFVAILAGLAIAQAPAVQQVPAVGPAVAPGGGGLGIFAFGPIGLDLWHQPNLGTPVVYKTLGGIQRAATIVGDYGFGTWDLITYENLSREPQTVPLGTPVFVPQVTLGVNPGEFFYVGL